jgi:RNA polymerase sigma-70 factor (ECF subfamily)
LSVFASGSKRDAFPDSTASDLLDAAKQRHEEAWQELVERYSRLVFQWCRNAGLNSLDAGDVVQSVLAQTAAYLPGFQKDGAKASFRRWLRTITRTKIADFRRGEGKQPHGEGGSAAQRRLLAVPDFTESSSQSDHPEVENRRDLLWQIVDRLEDEFEESTWQAFWLTVIENETAADAASRLDMTPNAVRIAKWRVLTRLREEADNSASDPRIGAKPG